MLLLLNSFNLIAQTKSSPPTNMTLINYYREIWLHWFHILTPLAALAAMAVTWKWIEVYQEVLDKMHCIIVQKTFLAYLDFSEPTDIHTDTSLYHLGVCISQQGYPFAFYSRNLNLAQTWYTITETKLLSIIKILKESRNIFLT